MKAKKLWFVMGVLVLVGGSGALWAAAPPGLINYQGAPIDFMTLFPVRATAGGMNERVE